MRLTAICTAGPVRHMSVLTGAGRLQLRTGTDSVRASRSNLGKSRSAVCLPKLGRVLTTARPGPARVRRSATA